ncbi:hypothetical protein JAAARDRAFT_188608 [Jaapia argillacea MUCL 33604]|uniref:RRM domain-containing protein n=1 Tax=Jaapia argillacea MUCL 33604 TaxID=933084 RepID=A0A067Q7Q1_9AGAM|nr:hypothetical protein JAAARDRAFT_188608 [Jaapia argillacea MUCL 33604]
MATQPIVQPALTYISIPIQQPLFLPSPAWQSQDIAPSGISIPTSDIPMANGNSQEQSWSNGGGRSPGRDQGGDPPRRSSRSRSPGAREEHKERGRGDNEGGGVNPGNNLHVSGLSYKVDTRDLEQAFAKVGRVKKAQVMYDPHSRESRGFGFVTMETGEEADAAVTALNATEFMGKTLTVEKARRGRARTPTPGRYYGPPKRRERGDERPYDPRPYDSRYARDYDDDRRGGGGGGRGGRYDDYRGGGGGGGGRYDRDYDRDHARPRYDDRRYDDRRYEDRRY